MHAYRVGPLSLLMDPFCTCFRVDACLYARLHTFVPPPVTASLALYLPPTASLIPLVHLSHSSSQPQRSPLSYSPNISPVVGPGRDGVRSPGNYNARGPDIEPALPTQWRHLPPQPALPHQVLTAPVRLCVCQCIVCSIVCVCARARVCACACACVCAPCRRRDAKDTRPSYLTLVVPALIWHTPCIQTNVEPPPAWAKNFAPGGLLHESGPSNHPMSHPLQAPDGIYSSSIAPQDRREKEPPPVWSQVYAPSGIQASPERGEIIL